MEAVAYLGLIVLRALDIEIESGAVLLTDDDNRIYIIRYLSWFLTCPLQIALFSYLEDGLARISGIRQRRIVSHNFHMVIMLGMLSTAMLMSIAPTPGFKIAYFMMGGSLCSMLFLVIFRVIRRYMIQLPDVKEGKYVLPAFYIGWSLFPITVLLSPLGFNVVEADMADAFFAIADIPAKNVLLYFTGKVTVALDEAVEKYEGNRSLSSSLSALRHIKSSRIGTELQPADSIILDRFIGGGAAEKDPNAPVPPSSVIVPSLHIAASPDGDEEAEIALAECRLKGLQYEIEQLLLTPQGMRQKDSLVEQHQTLGQIAEQLRSGTGEPDLSPRSQLTGFSGVGTPLAAVRQANNNNNSSQASVSSLRRQLSVPEHLQRLALTRSAAPLGDRVSFKSPAASPSASIQSLPSVAMTEAATRSTSPVNGASEPESPAAIRAELQALREERRLAKERMRLRAERKKLREAQRAFGIRQQQRSHRKTTLETTDDDDDEEEEEYEYETVQVTDTDAASSSSGTFSAASLRTSDIAETSELITPQTSDSEDIVSSASP